MKKNKSEMTELDNNEDSVQRVKRLSKLIPQMNLKELDEFEDELGGTCQGLSYCLFNNYDTPPEQGLAELDEIEGYFERIKVRRESLKEEKV